MALPPPKRVKMGAFYRVLRPMELSAGMRYTTSLKIATKLVGMPQRQHCEA
jgi:hypothetical protein